MHVLRGLLVALVACLAGCGAQLPFVWVYDFSPKTEDSGVIQPGDRISVQVKNQAQVSGEFDVRANGTYVQPLIGEVVVAGLTAEQASTRLAAQLKGIIVDPLVSVSVAAPRSLRIDVVGEVRTPGSLDTAPGTTLLTLLARVGGVTEFADEDDIYILRRSPKLVRIRFRYKDIVGGEPRSSNFLLRDRDVLVVE